MNIPWPYPDLLLDDIEEVIAMHIILLAQQEHN